MVLYQAGRIANIPQILLFDRKLVQAPPVFLLMAVLRGLIYFGSLVGLDVVCDCTARQCCLIRQNLSCDL